MSTIEKENEEFLQLIQQARKEQPSDPTFQGEGWNWVHELDDEGFFIFLYLAHDYKQQVISQKEFEDTVYTLMILRHKLIPPELQTQAGIPIRWQLQLLFDLYERMKNQIMSWEDCQNFLEDQLQKLPMRQDN
ncbi:MAG: hypothetical protein HQM14_12560 [SAR324 cluster bacterium]|nr:hypothetical protein [SAR324 cluster bacterium]